jgi:hypothetical protein
MSVPVFCRVYWEIIESPKYTPSISDIKEELNLKNTNYLVKRVTREINDPVRIFINSIQTN